MNKYQVFLLLGSKIVAIAVLVALKDHVAYEGTLTFWQIWFFFAYVILCIFFTVSLILNLLHLYTVCWNWLGDLK